jgi:hypothetical protein
MVVAPDRKVTAPVGVPAVEGVTVALNVTDSPKSDGFSEEVNLVVVESTSVTKETADDVLVSKSVDPP